MGSTNWIQWVILKRGCKVGKGTEGWVWKELRRERDEKDQKLLYVCMKSSQVDGKNVFFKKKLANITNPCRISIEGGKVPYKTENFT